MNEEIREILNEFENLFEISEAPENIIKDFNMIKDYIDNLQQENQKLKENLEKIKQPTIFIDTQDMEERYGEQLYQDYLVEQNKDLKHIIDELEKWLEERIDMCFTTIPDYEIYIARQEEKHILQEVLNKLQELKGSDNNA